MKKGKKKLLKLFAFVAVLALMTSFAGCQSEEEFPSKQISLVIQAAPGGESDMTGRLVGQTMEKELGVPVVASNRTGAAGAVAFQYVKSQEADGYTIGICPAEIAMVEALGLSEIVPDDMDFLGGAAETSSSLIVSADAPYDTLEEFIEYAKANPGQLKSGTAGAGSTLHIASALLERAADISFNYVPYDGSSEAITALMGGHVDVVTIGVLAAKAGVDSGDLKILAILGEERVEQYPDVPTAQEVGVDCVYTTWVGLYAPSGLDSDVKATLEAAVKAGIEGEPYQNFAKERGLNIKYRTAAEFTEFVNENYEMYSELIPTLNLN